MSFRPSIHGWPFGRVGETESHVLGLGAPPAGGPGLGGGLCWSALDRYLRGVGIPRELAKPEPGTALYSELVRRQVAALSGAWSRVGEWQARPAGSWRDRLPIRVFGGRDVTSLTRREWPAIRSSLDAGVPILLTLLDPTDGYRRSHAARQVLATAWRQDDVRIVVSIYHPDRPRNDGIRLSFMPTGPLDARLNDGSQVRGFWATHYDRVVPAPLRVESFGDRSVIGLNRPVEGGVAAVAGRRRIDLVARNERRALLHFRRTRGGSWESYDITGRHGLGAYELHSDPAIVRAGGIHVFARSYVGDLLHFRAGRKWRVTNRTDQKRAGAGFRLTGQPLAVAGPWGRISVLGRDGDGALIHYTVRPPLPWRAERVPGDPLSADPVATWVDSTLHVAGTDADGRLLHREWDGQQWTLTESRSLRSSDDAPPVASRVVLGAADGAVYIAARSIDDRLVVLRRKPTGGWDATVLSATVAGDPVVTTGPAGIHVFCATRAGGLVHAWRDDVWCEEELPETRSSLPALPPTLGLSCCGSRDELRVWGRADDDLWSLVWRPDADWILERLSNRPGAGERHRPDDDPVVLRDGAGFPHLFFTVGRGTILHMDPADWREPVPPRSAMNQPQAEPENRPELEAPIRPEPESSAEPDSSAEPELEFAAEAEPDTGAEPVRPAGGWGLGDARELRWQKPRTGHPSPSEIEPMDLSLLDSWQSPPPVAPERQKRAKPEPERERSRENQNPGGQS